MGSAYEEVRSPNGGALIMEQLSGGRLSMRVSGVAGCIVTVPLDELASALNRVADGFSAKYVAPIVVPTYLGAAVERPTSDRHLKHQRYVRWAPDDETSLPWIGRDGTKYSNDDIAAVLANGGFERQPEFPPNG